MELSITLLLRTRKFWIILLLLFSVNIRSKTLEYEKSVLANYMPSISGKSFKQKC